LRGHGLRWAGLSVSAFYYWRQAHAFLSALVGRLWM